MREAEVVLQLHWKGNGSTDSDGWKQQEGVKEQV